jgi:predicted secreted protein
MRRVGVGTLILFVLLGACSGQGAVTLTAADSGTEVDLESGGTLEVTLESNATTGYQWVIAEGSLDYLSLIEERYEEPDTDLVGAPGEQVFVFDVSGQGAGILRLEYVRPFDDPIIPERVVEYIVIIDEAEWPPRDGSPPETSSASVPDTTQP